MEDAAAAGLEKFFKKKKTPWKIKYVFIKEKDQLPDLICSGSLVRPFGATA